VTVETVDLEDSHEASFVLAGGGGALLTVTVLLSLLSTSACGETRQPLLELCSFSAMLVSPSCNSKAGADDSEVEICGALLDAAEGVDVVGALSEVLGADGVNEFELTTISGAGGTLSGAAGELGVSLISMLVASCGNCES
jgi:hypothetical protein